MFDWLAKQVENYTERRHAGVVTITWDKFANDVLTISWLNEQTEKGFFSNSQSTTSITTRIDREALRRMRHFQDLGADALGYKLPLPLGDFKVGLITTGGEGAETCIVRVRDCHGDEENFVIEGNWIQITMPSNDISAATVRHTEGENDGSSNACTDCG